MTTPSQTVGPFFALGMPDIAGSGTLTVTGRIFDGAGDPVTDALVEAWQDDPPSFARCATDATGRWTVRCHRPSPYVDLSVFGRGLLDRVVTRLYAFDDPADPVLAALDPDRRRSLIAERTDDGYALDIHLQGPHETVFFRL